jgi:hypothetical protein
LKNLIIQLKGLTHLALFELQFSAILLVKWDSFSIALDNVQIVLLLVIATPDSLNEQFKN